ncbi:MAG: hypothetical protein M3P83_10930 [Actinomycetota bacterium]|nr:hypothetical protein [Actinomycetota bacterium]
MIPCNNTTAGLLRATSIRPPADLLPEGWPGRRAHDLFVAAHDALAGPADGHVAAVLERQTP